MIECATQDDLDRRLEARRAHESDRIGVLCRRCRKPIPEGRRCDARVCSRRCHGSMKWEERNTLVAEIRHARRLERYPDLLTMRCGCGADLHNTLSKPGKPRTMCEKCRIRTKNKRSWTKRRDNK